MTQSTATQDKSAQGQAILNIAAYKFVSLGDLSSWKRRLEDALFQHRLKGTILLSPEGINMFLAGSERAVRGFMQLLTSWTEFEDLEFKESYSDRQPFNRTLVRLKKEIIAFGVQDIDPVGQASSKLKAEQLREWLDQGRDITLLDVRNDYEIELGTFEDALPIGVDNFRDFPAAVSRLPAEIKDKPVVMFCTGGIRCEKAGPYMERAGFKNVFQLDGGILKYFESVGGQHYRGDCFVFDQRVAVDPSLAETDAELCYVCQATLTPADQQSPQYVPGKSCPFCYEDPASRAARLGRQRTAQIQELTDPLPGSFPADNVRPITVSSKCDGMSLIDLLDRAHPHVGRDTWLERICDGLIRLHDLPVSATQTVAVGEKYQHLQPQQVEPDVDANIEILFEDDWMVVVNKPAPLPMHPSGRFNRNTLTSILKQAYGQQLRSAHRLDANTTGIVVLSRTKAAARRIQPQFEQKQVEKTYLARVQGHPSDDEFSCELAISSEPVQVGLRLPDPQGLTAKTDFRVIERNCDDTALVEVHPVTGRTNQIRVHLWSLGHPIVGDPAYLPGSRLGTTQTLPVDGTPMCLHAWRLRFDSYDGTAVEMVARPPDFLYELSIPSPTGSDSSQVRTEE